jgi:hypothetical protein
MSAIASTPIVKVQTLNGFTANQRVSGQDVATRPPKLYSGTIGSVWSDGSAIVRWDPGFTHEAERHFVKNGFVDLHYLSRLA